MRNVADYCNTGDETLNGKCPDLSDNPGTGDESPIKASESKIQDHFSIFAATMPGEIVPYQTWRNAVAEELSLRQMDDLADEWLNCSQHFATFPLTEKNDKLPSRAKSVYVCADDPNHHAVCTCFTCHNRLCPECARRDSARLLSRYGPLVEDLAKQNSISRKFVKITLTTNIDVRDPDARQKTDEIMNKIPSMFSKWWGKKWRKHSGFLLSLEIGPAGKKIHFHILAYGKWIENRNGYENRLQDAWAEITGITNPIVWISNVNKHKVMKDLIENIKYITKFWKRDDDGNVIYLEPSLIPDLMLFFKGMRRIRSYGVFYSFKPVKTAHKCPTCKSDLVRWTPIEWEIFVHTGWFPDEQRSMLNLKHGDKSDDEKDCKKRKRPPPNLIQVNFWGNQ